MEAAVVLGGNSRKGLSGGDREKRVCLSPKERGLTLHTGSCVCGLHKASSPAFIIR